MNASTYPYEPDDPYAFDPEDIDDDDEWLDDIGAKFNVKTRFGARGRHSPSPPGDTFSYASSPMVTAGIESVYVLDEENGSYQRIFTTTSRSSRPTVGTKKGWSRAPFNAADEDDPDPPFDFEDIIDRELEDEPQQLKRMRARAGKFEW